MSKELEFSFYDIVSDKNVSLKENDISFVAILSKKNKFIKLKAHIFGKLSVDCYKCGQDLKNDIDLNISCLISNGAYNGDNEDVIYEAINSKINCTEIFLSELETLKNDYFICKECELNNE